MNRAATFLTMAIFIFPSVAWADTKISNCLMCMDGKGGVELCDHQCKDDHDHAFIGTPDNLNPIQIIEDDNQNTSWHLLTVSHSGTVSLIKGLSKGECEELEKRVRYKIMKVGKIYPNNDDSEPSDIDRAECFQ